MKIKSKFLLGLSTQPILLIMILLIGWIEISSINRLEGSTQDNYQLVLLAEETHREVKNEAISLRNIILFTDEDSLQKELTYLQLANDAVSKNIDSLELKVYTKEQKELIKHLKEINENFTIYTDQIISLISEGKRQEAIELINDNGHNLHEEFFQVLSDLNESLETSVLSTFSNASKDLQREIIISSLIAFISIILSFGFLGKMVWKLAMRLGKVSATMSNIANGKLDLSTRVEVESNDEIDEVANSFNGMVQSLEEQTQIERSLIWSKSNIAEITTSLNGFSNVESLSQTFLSKIVPLMDSCKAAFFVTHIEDSNNNSSFKRIASYAINEKSQSTFQLGEGLIGQAALEKSPIFVSGVHLNNIELIAGVGEASPLNIHVWPIIVNGNVIGVIELASFKKISETQQSFMDELISHAGIILDNTMKRIQLAKVLEETQALMEEIQVQSEELQSQQEELRMTNEELEEQTQVLKQSEEKLQAQQEELEETNTELKEKAMRLEEQNKKYEIKNKEVEKARAELEEKARLLTLSSKYKSEFLANMSHELRTPLNSLLILSKLLADNHEGNLSNKQIEYSNTIYSSGKDLLILINDILDLAKIESGKMDIHPSVIQINSLVEMLDVRFRPISNEKGLHFHIDIKEGTPQTIYSDEKRLLQVLENLLSNAFKFTEKGKVCLEIGSSSYSKNDIVFSVTDTGIGIPKDKKDLIFQAFQQADGTTSRKYGGTGLGLSISRETSILLGGEIKVESEEGKGSTFTFSLGNYQSENNEKDESNDFQEVAVTIETISSTSEDEEQSSTAKKAKISPSITTDDQIKRLLIVDDDHNQRISLMELIGNMNVVIKAVSNGSEALEELKVNQFDFMIMDLGLADTNGFELLNKIMEKGKQERLDIIIYTGRNLTSKEELYLNQHAHTIIIKDSMAPQRLVEELALLLNEGSCEPTSTDLNAENMVKNIPELKGKRIMLVDDDVRNVYALSSFLELYGLNITFAENGVDCLQILKEDRQFDLILMDIMMPEMDGYEAITKIRSMQEYHTLPIIALTAKAMKEDREKCIEAGASDYIVKPFDPEQLISLIQVWLYSQEGKKMVDG
ncbi:response regulator [Robertmurraya sp. GLU-23]